MDGRIWRLFVRYLLLIAAALLVNFFLPRLLPGDPLSFGAGSGLDTASPLPAAARAQLRAYYHLDQPLGRQLLMYLRDLAHGDLGWSIATPAPVRSLILARLPWTLALVLTALLISALVGTAIGVVAGWLPGRARDSAWVSVGAALAAVPDFLVAIGLLFIFGFLLGWFPLLGGQTLFTDFGTSVIGRVRQTLDVTRHLVLPAGALVLTGTSAFMLIARDATVGVRNEPWLTVARSKGLGERQIALRHALPNLAPPLLTFFALRLGTVLGGALVVERVFSVPGLGLLAYQAIQARDYPVLQALFLISSLGVLLANLATELLYVRLETRRGATGA